MISVQNLYKRFGNVRALSGLSFEARDGEITGLLGANGAGKSTALRIACAIMRPDSGSAHIDEICSTEAPIAALRKIGAVLDHTGLYARLTTREHLAYFAELHGVPPHRVQETLAMLGLEEIADRRSTGFSQGERMKTALGRALVHGPRNIILDEPTNGLDVPAVRALRDVIKRLRDQGACILFSSHVLEEVRTLCDKVCIMAGGRQVAQGTPDEICVLGETKSFEDAYVRLTC
jgi:sodium transport system ATP-binding protein